MKSVDGRLNTLLGIKLKIQTVKHILEWEVYENKLHLTEIYQKGSVLISRLCVVKAN